MINFPALADGTHADKFHAKQPGWVFFVCNGTWGGANLKLEVKDRKGDTYHQLTLSTSDAPLTGVSFASVTNDLSTRFYAGADQTFQIIIAGGAGESIDVAVDGRHVYAGAAN